MRKVVAREKEICRCVKILLTQHSALPRLRPPIQGVNPKKTYDMIEITPQAKMFKYNKTNCLWEGRKILQPEVT